MRRGVLSFSSTLRVAVLLLASLPHEGWCIKYRSNDSYAATSSYTLVLQNHNNVQYVANIRIGGQEVPVLFDTGSGGLVVKTKGCIRQGSGGRQCTTLVPSYDPDESKSNLNGGEIRKLTYGAGTCNILKAYETVEVGPMVANQQEIWQVQSHSIGIWDSAAYSAVAGLGPGGGIHKTLLETLAVPEFSACFEAGEGSKGYLTLGKNDAVPSSQLSTAKVVGAKHWEVALSHISLITSSGNGTAPAVNLCSDSSCSAIIDTGHSLIEGPQAEILALGDHIPIKRDCSNFHELPILKFELGDGIVIELPPQAYVMKVTGKSMEAERVWGILPTTTGQPFEAGTCHPALLMGRQWVFGMPFFRHYRTTFFRGEDPSIGFTPVGPSCDPQALSGLSVKKRASLLAQRYEKAKPLEIDLGAVLRGSAVMGFDPDA